MRIGFSWFRTRTSGRLFYKVMLKFRVPKSEGMSGSYLWVTSSEEELCSMLVRLNMFDILC
jgi:hypothetical protein